jgi:membrane-bound serine protease (ClpP class)
VGEEGEAMSDIGPDGGRVFVHGEYWSGRAETPVPQGVRVRVTAVEGLLLTVVEAGRGKG